MSMHAGQQRTSGQEGTRRGDVRMKLPGNETAKMIIILMTAIDYEGLDIMFRNLNLLLVIEQFLCRVIR